MTLLSYFVISFKIKKCIKQNRTYELDDIGFNFFQKFKLFHKAVVFSLLDSNQL